MSGDDQTTNNGSESISEAAVEANSPRPQEKRSATPGGPRKRSRTNYDGSQPLDDPGHEAVAQFFSAPKHCRRFKSSTALAEHFRVSRMTIYRWAQDLDVVKRTEWLATRNTVFGDFLARREWLGIVEAQVAAALAGSTRAAIFCQNRAFPERSIFGTLSLEAVIEGAINVETSLEADETAESEKLGPAKENPEMVEDKNSQE